MNFDFAALLALLTFVTGIIWAVDSVFFAPKRRERIKSDTDLENESDARLKNLSEPRIVEYSRSFFPVILIVLLLRSFLVEPFRIPSNSMMPTLLTGDFILVNKFAYGIRLPVIHSKIVGIGAPKNGDVVVFRFPENPSIDYIKRVIGVPNDHVVYKNKKLFINDKLVKHDYQGIYEGIGAGVTMSGANLIEEELLGVNHSILVNNRPARRETDFFVPEGEYFVMGDNRDNSNDSRYWGTVPEKNLVGKAFFIWMNYDSEASGMAWGRIGSRIR